MSELIGNLANFRTWIEIRRWIESLSPDVVQLVDAQRETMGMIMGNEHGLLQTGSEWYWEWFNQIGALSDDEFAAIRKYSERSHWDYERNLNETG